MSEFEKLFNRVFPTLRQSASDVAEFVIPHVKENPRDINNYARDINEWIFPSAQMALDEYEGKRKYPIWAYAVSSIPVVGKASKPLTKFVAKSAKKIKPMTKAEKAEAVIKNNPATDDYHLWIRSADDIKDFNEARRYTLEDVGDVSSFPDVTKEILDKAEKTGKIKLYSSKPFSVGNFVSPSKMQVKDYAGSGKIYEGIFDVDDIAWINADEGQIARMGKK